VRFRAAATARLLISFLAMGRTGIDAISSSRAPENSLGHAMHVVQSSVTSAALYALVAGVGTRAVTLSIRRLSKEMKLMIPALSATVGAILGAQQGTLQALIDVQPIASHRAMQRDLDESLEKAAIADKARGGSRTTTYVIREHRSWLDNVLGRSTSPDRTELISHSNASLNARSLGDKKTGEESLVDADTSPTSPRASSSPSEHSPSPSAAAQATDLASQRAGSD